MYHICCFIKYIFCAYDAPSSVLEDERKIYKGILIYRVTFECGQEWLLAGNNSLECWHHTTTSFTNGKYEDSVSGSGNRKWKPWGGTSLVHRLKEVGEGWLIIAWEAVGLVVRDMEGESAGANSVGPWRS